jgi:hypothetical protein
VEDKNKVHDRIISNEELTAQPKAIMEKKIGDWRHGSRGRVPS